MKPFLHKTFHFSPPERRGAVVLLLLCFLAFIWPLLYPLVWPKNKTDFSGFEQELALFRQGEMAQAADAEAEADDTVRPKPELFPFDPNTASMADFLRLGLPERTAKSICNYRDKGGRFRKPEDFQKIYVLSLEDYTRLLPYIQLEEDDKPTGKKWRANDQNALSEPFDFDPNTASLAEMLQLGFPEWLAQRIIKFRERGGRFKQKEDLAKIYGFPKELYTRLEPHIIIKGTLADASKPVQYGSSAANPPLFPAQKAPPGPVDINRSSLEDWMRLPGIGDTRARMIVNFREKLGGFVSISQVVETRYLPDSIFKKIEPYLVLNFKDLRKININSADAAALDAHPYISPKQASIIFAYRDQNGLFKSIDDLLKLPAFTNDKVWLEKVRPYLALE